jgi:oligoribonuclease (3'-5' exoribonuclease)
MHDVILDDRRMKVREIAGTMGLLKERVGYILDEGSDMKKLCGKWVPRLLKTVHKRTRMKMSEQCLERFNKNKIDPVRRFISMDETLIHHYTL